MTLKLSGKSKSGLQTTTPKPQDYIDAMMKSQVDGCTEAIVKGR